MCARTHSLNSCPVCTYAYLYCGYVHEVRPIGIGEVPRRIIVKAILELLKQDIVDASGPLQVCAGQENGCKAAIHAICQTFAEVDTEGAFLINATNAFNLINRQ